MLTKIFLIIILGIAGLWVISMIPKPIGKAMSEFLIISGVIGLLLAVLMFGFKPIREKAWWET
jgi:predicted membrane channel-forming protein YqfA (hemolysin III family)